MNAFSSTTWRIIAIRLQAPPLWQAARTPATFVLTKGSRNTLQAVFSPRFLRIQPELSRTRLDIDLEPINAPRTRSGQCIPRQQSISSSFIQPKRWRSGLLHQSKTSKTYEPVLPEISAGDIHAIFGGSLEEKEGNELLRILHDQRVSGTLDEEVPASPNNIRRGLAWLRLTLPIDEDGALIARLEKEEYEAGQEYIAYTRRNYSRSVLEEFRDHNRTKAVEREAAERELAEENADQGGNSSTDMFTPEKPPPKAVITRRTESPEWVRRYKEAATSEHAKPPAMTKFQRLWPSAVFTLAVVGLSILFAQNYTPPSRNARLWPDLPPAAATLTALISVNVVVFLAWRIVPPAWKFLNLNFLVIPGMPRSISMVGSLFSHQSVMHLFSNMLGIWVIGTRLHDDIGRGTFLAIFFSTGVIASYASLCGFVLRNILHTTSLGASGALSGILGTWCWIHASEKIAFPFVPLEYTRNIPVIGILIVWVAVDIVGLFRRKNILRTDYMSHLGGYAAGIMAGESLKQRAGLHRLSGRERQKHSSLMDDPSQGRI